MAVSGELVHVVICMQDDGSEIRHIFSTRERAEAFMLEDDDRGHIYYDYVLDDPERHEGRHVTH